MPSIGEGGGHNNSINRDHYSRLYRLNEFDMGTFSQMAAQLQSIVPDPSMIGPMLTAAATGIGTNYVSGKLGKLNPMDKIEQAVTSKLDNTRVGRWVNRKIDQASDYMDRKLGNNTTGTTSITPEIRSAIGSEVTAQLNARGVGTRSSSTPPAGGSSGSRSTPPTPPSPPSSTGGSGGASGGGGR